MKIGVYLLDNKTPASACGYICARALAISVHRLMKDVSVVHFTDEHSPIFDGADEVYRRQREKMAQLRMAHQADVHGEWLFVDTDVIFQQDVRPVFNEPFDIGITDRTWPHLKPAAGFTERMPFNTGVVFSRSRQFWCDAYQRIQDLPKDEREWMGDQDVIAELVASGQYQIARFSGAKYNFPPSLTPDETSTALEAQAAILHFKGEQRKSLICEVRASNHLWAVLARIFDKEIQACV